MQVPKPNLTRHACLLGCWLALITNSIAATPPPDKLLASDTLAVFTVPDYARTKAASSQWPGRQLWADPAVKPFADKLLGKIKSDLLAPLEREFGVNFSEFAGLVQGQLTFALTQNGWDGKSSATPGFLILLDAKDRGEALKTNLSDLKKKWVDSGKQIKTDKIRDIEFTTLIFSSDDLTKALEKAFPDPNAGNESLDAPKAKKPGKKVEFLLGQSDSLLILGNSAQDIEKILVRQGGGNLPSLAEQPSFASCYANSFREAVSYGWINIKTIMDIVMKQAAGAGNAPNPNPMMPRPDKILSVVGLTGLQHLSFNLKDTPEGCVAAFQLGTPESERRGLFKILAADAKDSSPPPFVPADAVKFNRWRLDLQKGLATLESMLTEANPQVGSVIKLFVDNAGKDKDKDFDLRKNLIANLGDDFISYQKAPRGQTLADLGSPPSLYLISSPRAEQLAAALKALTSFMPQQTKAKEREFLGRKVYSIALPGAGGGPRGRGRAGDGPTSVSYAASGGYVAISTDPATLEEFLRGDTTKPLREIAGLTEAAQKVGGFGTGLFSFQNDRETMRATLETLKKESGSIANLFSASPFAARLGLDEGDKKFKDWVDFSLLPSFDKISKYFYYTLLSGSVTPQGFELKVFTPNSPEFRGR